LRHSEGAIIGYNCGRLLWWNSYVNGVLSNHFKTWHELLGLILCV